ncbi:MAG TPA: hypothetical protein VF992_04850 [Thermoplasmata archaeon]
MTTLRLTELQKRKLRKASEILEAVTGRRFPHGDAVEALAEFALRHRELLAEESTEFEAVPEEDPFFDLSIVFDMGRTDARTIDRLLYGRK